MEAEAKNIMAASQTGLPIWVFDGIPLRIFRVHYKAPLRGTKREEADG